MSIAYLSDHGQGCAGIKSKVGLTDGRADDYVP